MSAKQGSISVYGSKDMHTHIEYTVYVNHRQYNYLGKYVRGRKDSLFLLLLM
jgi:hypothetical protein